MCYLYLFSRLDLRLAFRYSLLKGDIIDFPYFFINLNSSAYEIFQCQRSMFAQKFVTANCDNENFIIETCTSLIYMFASFRKFHDQFNYVHDVGCYRMHRT